MKRLMGIVVCWFAFSVPCFAAEPTTVAFNLDGDIYVAQVLVGDTVTVKTKRGPVLLNRVETKAGEPDTFLSVEEGHRSKILLQGQAFATCRCPYSPLYVLWDGPQNGERLGLVRQLMNAADHPEQLSNKPIILGDRVSIIADRYVLELFDRWGLEVRGDYIVGFRGGPISRVDLYHNGENLRIEMRRSAVNTVELRAIEEAGDVWVVIIRDGRVDGPPVKVP